MKVNSYESLNCIRKVKDLYQVSKGRIHIFKDITLELNIISDENALYECLQILFDE